MPVYDALVGSGIRHILVRHNKQPPMQPKASPWPRIMLASAWPHLVPVPRTSSPAWPTPISIPFRSWLLRVKCPAPLGTDAFQEVDAFGLMMPVVKHSFKVLKPENLSANLEQAFHLATTGRQGPVHVDLPKDIAAGSCPDSKVRFFPVVKEPSLDQAAIEEARVH